MRTILFILQKEFRQLFRDKTMLPIIFIIPVFQLVILSFTATFEIKHTRLVVVDEDRSAQSRELISRFEGSAFFIVKAFAETYPQAAEFLKNGDADQLIVIPENFERDIINRQNTDVLLVTDAINGSAASLMSAYAMSIINSFNQFLVVEQMPLVTHTEPISIESSYWYNPRLNYLTYMVPGILVLLVTIIAMFLSGMNVVKEKELGTIEQINVTPILKYQFIIGKLLPFWMVAIFELLFGLAIARFLFQVPFLGSLPLLLGVASVYLLVVLGFGLFVSTVADTMQQSMFISWFLLVVFILMSGLFTPVESMPEWAQWFNKLNPVSYFIKINRMIMLKGSGFSDFSNLFYTLVVYAAAVLSLSVWRYKKVA